MADIIQEATIGDEPLSFWGRHRLSLLLVVTIGVTIALTIISIAIYTMSGAAQLDLSRPGYQSVSDKVEKDSGIETYSSSGAVTQSTIDDFMKLYSQHAEGVKRVDAFNGDPLNPEILQLAKPEE